MSPTSGSKATEWRPRCFFEMEPTERLYSIHRNLNCTSCPYYEEHKKIVNERFMLANKAAAEMRGER